MAGAILGVAAMAPGADAQPAEQSKPVLVELFTSEGCSDCPPADRLLEALDKTQPFAGEHAIVLSEHVTYWNQLGWRDPFSMEEMTERQQAYVNQFRLNSPYTPQMVVDGAAQFTGGDTRRAAVEIGKAAGRPKAAIVLGRNGSSLKVDIDSVPHESDIWLALADDRDATQVAAGENKGRKLTHVAVVRSLRKIGWVKRGGTFSRLIDLSKPIPGQRVVVFLQEPGQARVWGAAMLPAREN